MDCVHRFLIDSKNVGTCSLCGEVRQYPWEKGPVIVLKKGRPSINQVQKKGNITKKITNQVSEKEDTMPDPRLLQRYRYYEDNKEAITADLLSRGRALTRERWGIPKGTLNHLMARWLTEEQKASIPNPDEPTAEVNPTPPNSTPTDGALPPLPPFSNEWDPAVQLEWLRLYGVLARSPGGS